MGKMEFLDKVVHKGERPKIDKSWPKGFITLLQSCWSVNPAARPSFHTVIKELHLLIEEANGMRGNSIFTFSSSGSVGVGGGGGIAGGGGGGSAGGNAVDRLMKTLNTTIYASPGPSHTAGSSAGIISGGSLLGGSKLRINNNNNENTI